MNSTNSITQAFNLLSDNEPYLTKSSFTKNIKLYQVPIFNELTPEDKDYEQSCEELFTFLVSQCEYNESPQSLVSSKRSKEELPEYLKFVIESNENLELKVLSLNDFM